MAITGVQPPQRVYYPSSDGQPVAESDFQLHPLLYAVTALRTYFQDRADVYVAGDMFIYYEEGNPEAVVGADVFVLLGTAQRDRASYMLWQGTRRPEIVRGSTSTHHPAAKPGLQSGTPAR